MRGNNMITPARATVMADLKKVRHIVLSNTLFFDSCLSLLFKISIEVRPNVFQTQPTGGMRLQSLTNQLERPCFSILN